MGLWAWILGSLGSFGSLGVELFPWGFGPSRSWLWELALGIGYYYRLFFTPCLRCHVGMLFALSRLIVVMYAA